MPPTNKRRFEGEWVKLGDVCEIVNGYAFKSKNYVSEGIRIIRIANVQKGYLEDSNPCYYPLSSNEDIERFALEKNDLLLSLTGNVGRVALLPDNMLPAALNQRVACLRVKVAEDFDKNYLFHILNSSKFEQDCISSAKGLAQKNLSTNWVKEYAIPCPPIEVQREISCLIRKVSSMIEESNSLLLRLDDLVKSRFTEIFGDPFRNPLRWPIGSVDMIADNLDSKRIPITQSDRQAGPYPYYGATGAVDFVSDYIFDEDLLLVSEDGANLLARTYPIAFSISGKTWVNNHAHVLRTASASSRIYLETLINMLDISEFVTGSAQPKLNQKKLNQIPIMITPAALQQEFAGFVARIDKLRFVCACLIRNFGTTHDKIP